MKKYVVVFVVLALAVLAFMPAPDIEADKAAIIKLNEKQMISYNAGDYKATKEVWAHEPYIIHAFSDPPTVGWKAIDERYKGIFGRRNSASQMTDRTASNIELYVHGNVAFMLYDEDIKYTEDGEKKTNAYKTLKYFEKIKGEWKVIAVIPR